MTLPPLYASDVAFTPAVKDIQTRKGSREAYARVEQSGWKTEVDDALAAFIGEQTSFFLATSNADGQPYIQHRGGPAGFIKILDSTTLAFADFRGNRQYITQGNLTENPNVHRRRIKVWGTARVVEDDPALVASLMPRGYRAKPEQAIVFKITAWDANCPQHIPQKIDIADVAAALAARDARIAELEARIAELTQQQADTLSHGDGSK